MMQRLVINKSILALTCFLLWTPQVAADTTWAIAPGRSSIHFKVKHLIFMHVDGQFKQFEGTVVSPGEGFANAQVQTVIQADSIYTGNQHRDQDLLSKDFFDTREFPQLTFQSTSVTQTGMKTFRIIGELTMRGVTRPIELDARCVEEKELANGKICAKFVATGVLNRFDYGLRWNELMETGGAIVGEEIEITLKVALIKDDANQELLAAATP